MSTTKTIVLIKLCSVRLSHIIVLIESFLQRDSLIQIIDILSLIDFTLVKQLAVDVGHRNLKVKLLNLLIIGSALFIFVEGSVLFVFLNHRSSMSFLSFWIASSFSFAIISLRYLQIITFIHIIRSRLSIINSYLNKIDKETFLENHSRFVSIVGLLEEDNRDILKMQNKKFNHFDEITILGKLFGKLHDVSKLINSCFGTSLLVCIGNDFGSVTLNGYWMYLKYKRSVNVPIICSIGLWSLPHIVCLLLIAWFCYSTVCKVSGRIFFFLIFC